MRVGGRPAVVAQWQNTGGSSQRCPGVRLLAAARIGYDGQKFLFEGTLH